MCARPTSLCLRTSLGHYLNDNFVSCSSRTQSMPALSTCGAKYIASTTATRDTLQFRRVLLFLGILFSTPLTMKIENQTAIGAVLNRFPSKPRRYIDLRHHYLRHHISPNNITIQHMPSHQQPADVLAKPLKHQDFANNPTQMKISFWCRKKCVEVSQTDRQCILSFY